MKTNMSVLMALAILTSGFSQVTFGAEVPQAATAHTGTISPQSESGARTQVRVLSAGQSDSVDLVVASLGPLPQSIHYPDWRSKFLEQLKGIAVNAYVPPVGSIDKFKRDGVSVYRPAVIRSEWMTASQNARLWFGDLNPTGTVSDERGTAVYWGIIHRSATPVRFGQGVMTFASSDPANSLGLTVAMSDIVYDGQSLWGALTDASGKVQKEITTGSVDQLVNVAVFTGISRYFIGNDQSAIDKIATYIGNQRNLTLTVTFQIPVGSGVGTGIGRLANQTVQSGPDLTVGLKTLTIDGVTSHSTFTVISSPDMIDWKFEKTVANGADTRVVMPITPDGRLKFFQTVQ